MPLDAIVGHRRLVSLLSRAAARDTVLPSLLFAGPSGVGKRTTALALAEAINCTQPRATETLERDACGTCASCSRIARGVHPDVITVAPGDSGSIKIEQVRAVIDQAAYRPFEARRRVVVIDEADAMVGAAQSALLKTLEEPPSASILVLVSSIADRLLGTIRSRCPRLRFGPLSVAEVADVLMTQHKYDSADARAAAADADGSIGRALAARSSDLVAARDDACRLLERTSAMTDPARRLELAKDLVPKRKTTAEERDQLASCLLALSSLLRDLAVLGPDGDRRLLANADLVGVLDRVTPAFPADRVGAGFRAVDQALGALSRNANPKVVADWLVLQL